MTPLHSLSLLTELGAWIGHIFFRDSLYSLYSSLDDQVCAICTSSFSPVMTFRSHIAQAHVAKGIRLQWVPTNRPYASAMFIYFGPSHRLMLVG